MLILHKALTNMHNSTLTLFIIATEKRRDVSVSGGSRGSNHVNKDSLSLLLLPPSLSFPESSHLFLALLFFMSALFSVRPSLSGTRQPPVALDIYSACLVYKSIYLLNKAIKKELLYHISDNYYTITK